ncbi:MAG: hypothetical protein NTZ16_02320 [Verrucomicrobia bacterium]|nr:hypothetical protein [Verrucomicrobiota bacterium]
MQLDKQIRGRLTRILAGVILLICIPATAHANVGTPLMWASMLHLTIGNTLIGIFEGLILAKVFRLKTRTCIIALILANYFSAWAGGLFLNHWATAALPFNLYNAWQWLWVMVASTYIMTLVLEWPFVFLCFRNEPEKLGKALRGNLLVNSLSYVLLFGWYWLASGTTLYTKMNVVQPSAMTWPAQGILYYISEAGDSVCSLNLKTHQTDKVSSLAVANKDDRLFVRPSVSDDSQWDILACVWDKSRTRAQAVTVLSNLTVIAAQSWRDEHSSGRTEGTWFNFGEASNLGAAEKNDWKFRTGFWPIEGLRGQNTSGSEHIRFSLETPFVAWVARNATHLPGDYVVFQLGDDQICLLEATTKKICLLAKGRGPVVVIPRE